VRKQGLTALSTRIFIDLTMHLTCQNSNIFAFPHSALFASQHNHINGIENTQEAGQKTHEKLQWNSQKSLQPFFEGMRMAVQ
jgi:hypothetical protein